jgi:hypothetical protein
MSMLRRACVTAVLLVAFPATVHALDHHGGHHHHGSSGGGGCGGGDDEANSTSSHGSTSHSTPSTPPPHHARVFVTSTSHSGALGGVVGADALCQKAAQSKSLTGTFRAWISDGATDARSRITASGPWYTVHEDHLAFFASDLEGAPKADLLTESSNRPQSLGKDGVWTDSDAQGKRSGKDCAGWTSDKVDATGATGSALAYDDAWGGGHESPSCDTLAPLVCFED